MNINTKPQKLSLEYEYDFILMGLVSSVKDYKLAWSINQTLGFRLKKLLDLEYDFNKGCKLFISNFIFETDCSSFRLLKNRSVSFINTNKPYLVPELKNYDYFVMLDGQYAIENSKYLFEIKKNPLIELTKKIEIEKLPSKENLLIN